MSAQDVVTILAAVGALVVTIFTALTAYKTKTMNEVQTKKIDFISIQVDGRLDAMLQELADTKRLMANYTGASRDVTSADKAQKEADAQHARTAKASASVAAGEEIKLQEGKP